MKTDLTRRRFLEIAGALGVAACGDADPTSEADPGGDLAGKDVAPPEPSSPGPDGSTPPPQKIAGIDLDAVPLAATDFPYAVMAGDATPTRAMLWTRHTGKDALHVQVEEVSASGAKGDVVVSRDVATGEKSGAGFVHVDASGLSGGTRYRYAFYTVDSAGKPLARSPFGRFRAALASNALEIVTFGGTSCTHQQGAPYPLLADAAKRDFDFFIHGGDHVYTDAGADAMTLPQYRAKYGTAWGQSGMTALHASTGMLTTWDDHEFANNWNPETFAKPRLDAALTSFFEHRAVRRDPAAPNRAWRSFVWGRTLEVIVLDARSERRPSTRATAKAQFISPAQMSWLKQRLSTSPAVFKFVVTSVPITNFPASAAGEADKWEGYPAQRNEILDYVQAQALKGVWWLSGDLHFGSIGGIGTSGPRLSMREVLMGPGGTNARTNITLSATQFDKVIEEKNYTSFRADPVAKRLTVEFVGAGGKSLFERTYAA